MWLMLSGDVEAKENFKYLSKHGTRSICAIFLENAKDINEIVNSVPEDLITGYQLRDIFDATKKMSDIRKKLYELILFNKRFPKALGHAYSKNFIDSDVNNGPLVIPKLIKNQSISRAKKAQIFENTTSSSEETSDTDDKDKKKGIKFDLVKFFTDLGAAECLKKLQKEDLLDPELFFMVEWSTIETVALSEIKPEGRKMKLLKKVKDMRDKYEKDGFIEYLDYGLLEMPED